MSETGNVKTPNILRAVVGFALYLLLVPALLFISAGTLDWPMAWVYTVMLLASTVGSRLIVLKKSPDTLRERAQFSSVEGTEPWDRLLMGIVGLLGPMVTMIVAGLDHRFAWAQGVPQAAQWLAVLVTAGGYGIAVWAMVVNRYFSAVVRIQADRGHKVVTAGPYRFVRHPAYAGSLWAYWAFPIMLDTLSVFVPALIMTVVLIIRTRLEDQMLREKLPGYQSYAEKTPYRLIPGLW